MSNEHAAIISRELNIPRRQVAATIKLLADGATIPFIARYRKEATGSLDEIAVKAVQSREEALQELDKRKEYIIEVIESQNAMTADLRRRIDETLDPTLLEDLYLPYKPRRRTKAAVAREAGLEPLARAIMAQTATKVERMAKKYVNETVPDAESVIAGALDIVAEWIAESEKARSIVRSRFQRSATVTSRAARGVDTDDPASPAAKFRDYFSRTEPLRLCSPHRYLAMRRGENEGWLKVSIGIDDEEMQQRLGRMFIRQNATDECAELMRRAIKDAYRRLILPSIESEMAQMTKDKADEAAISVFADNVRQLLMAPPLGRKRVMGIDPGLRTGCKVVCLDEQGGLLANDVVYPCQPVGDVYGAADRLCMLIDRYRIDDIAVGDGTGGRETMEFLSHITFPRRVQIHSVNEDGASIWSATDGARSEFPDKDITVRGAVSIARRLLDPLAELVKIPPESIGVGEYQHDVNPSRLRDSLSFVVERCVNSVGVNVNTASVELLSHVSGIGQKLASNIVAHRTENGPFRTRQDLLGVSRMGVKAFQQCAGFLRVPGSPNPLDNTGVHPERYALLEQMASDMRVPLERFVNDRNLLKVAEFGNYVTREVGLPTLNDIFSELTSPVRDPRQKSENVEFDPSVGAISDLHIGQELQGKVANLTSFGAFVDIGLHQCGLIHISQLSDAFITSPVEVVSVGQPVKVRVIDVDVARGRVALSLKGVKQ